MRSNRLNILGEIATVDHDKVLVIGALRTTAVTLSLAITARAFGRTTKRDSAGSVRTVCRPS